MLNVTYRLQIIERGYTAVVQDRGQRAERRNLHALHVSDSICDNPSMNIVSLTFSLAYLGYKSLYMVNDGRAYTYF